MKEMEAPFEIIIDDTQGEKSEVVKFYNSIGTTWKLLEEENIG